MKVRPRRTWTTVLQLIVISGLVVEAIEPVSTSLLLGTGAAVLGTVGRKLYHYLYETCDENWLNFNAAGLKHDLDTKLYGQHVAAQVILKAVTGFMNNKNPKKPLVLSLHGSTGTGKTFVSQLIAENIYNQGIKSNFVHLFTATAHFPHEAHIDKYKTHLQEWIRGNVSICPRSMFIFDEMDKMHPGLMDSIKPYLDFTDNLDGVSYRQAIFIFLSNAGGEMINEVTVKFWRDGKEREEIQLRDLETELSQSVFSNEGSGLRNSILIDKKLVDFFVPFLPLEYKHVIQCGLAEMASQGFTPTNIVIKRMADDLIFFPKDERVFSVQGCKLIANKLHFYI
ncbi:torsin-1A-like [Carassius carassius]|uniref:torsin-1A-like n=1 Tax=Carassius carassius TaxID=217509 RepID=UPI002868D2FD|nr:torsin-1A-like [Carassius carassius]